MIIIIILRIIIMLLMLLFPLQLTYLIGCRTLQRGGLYLITLLRRIALATDAHL